MKIVIEPELGWPLALIVITWGLFALGNAWINRPR